MGVRGASSYDQFAMCTIVLLNLIYNTCECYQGDILVYAGNEEEYLFRLEKVCIRFRKHRLTVNPKKCKFGVKQLQFVGHTISKDGLSMSSEKREEVFNIEKPTLQKHLESFVGCAEYFHTHIRHCSDTVRLLHKMVMDYEKNRKLVLTPEVEIAFNLIRNPGMPNAVFCGP